MKYVLGVMAAVITRGGMSANSDEMVSGVGRASLNTSIAGYMRADRGSDRDGLESPEMMAIIESNREDRERTVIIDR